MKKTFKYLALTIFSIGLLTSCVDDKGYTDIVYSNGNSPVVSLGTDYEGLYPVAIPISASEPIPVPVTAARATSDLTATFKIDEAALDAYNEEHAEDEDFEPFVILPSSSYTISSLTVAIPKGTLDVDLDIKVNSLTLGLEDKYMLPLTLVSISGDDKAVLASNYKQVLLYVQLKNKYDGEYKTNIETRGWSAYSIADSKPQDYTSNIGLVTSAARSVGIANLLRGDDLLPAFSLNADGSTSATGFGAASPVFTFDENDKLISVVNAKPDDGRGRAFAINPAAEPGQNVFNADKKTITLNFLFKQTGRPDCVCIWKMSFAKDRS